jgi:chromosome segregation ATPase
MSATINEQIEMCSSRLDKAKQKVIDYRNSVANTQDLMRAKGAEMVALELRNEHKTRPWHDADADHREAKAALTRYKALHDAALSEVASLELVMRTLKLEQQEFDLKQKAEVNKRRRELAGYVGQYQKEAIEPLAKLLCSITAAQGLTNVEAIKLTEIITNPITGLQDSVIAEARDIFERVSLEGLSCKA